MSNLTPEQKASFQVEVNRGEQVREMLKHPGMVIMREIVDKLCARDNHRWLTMDKAEADKLWDKARGYESFFNLAKQVMLGGENAKKALKADSAPQE